MPTRTFFVIMAILVAILVVLQIIYAILLDHLDDHEQHRTPSTRDRNEVNLYKVEAERLLAQLFEAIRDRVRLDESGQYHIVHSVMGSGKEDLKDVALAIHASVENLNILPMTVNEWEGPVSVAVFVTAEASNQAALRLLALRVCSSGVVSLHLVMPPGVQLSYPVVPHKSALCRLLETPPPVSYQLSVAYPNNLLRNVARLATHAEFVLSLDADMAPNVGFRRQFLAMADKAKLWEAPGDLTAFVLPLYEVGAGVTQPRDKATLLELRRRWPQLLRPFYIATCAKCQAPTSFERWESTDALGRLEPLYDVPWKDPWEPVYVVRRGAPLYDPRFKQFGFNRISHACELHVAGYTFRVLSDGFVLHHGLKGEDLPRVGQQAEQDSNRLLFRQFKQELKAKYPESERRCY